MIHDKNGNEITREQFKGIMENEFNFSYQAIETLYYHLNSLENHFYMDKKYIRKRFHEYKGTKDFVKSKQIKQKIYGIKDLTDVRDYCKNMGWDFVIIPNTISFIVDNNRLPDVYNVY